MQRKTELEEAWEALKERTQERSITLSDSVEVHQVGRLWAGQTMGWAGQCFGWGSGVNGAGSGQGRQWDGQGSALGGAVV